MKILLSSHQVAMPAFLAGVLAIVALVPVGGDASKLTATGKEHPGLSRARMLTPNWAAVGEPKVTKNGVTVHEWEKGNTTVTVASSQPARVKVHENPSKSKKARGAVELEILPAEGALSNAQVAAAEITGVQAEEGISTAAVIDSVEATSGLSREDAAEWASDLLEGETTMTSEDSGAVNRIQTTAVHGVIIKDSCATIDNDDVYHYACVISYKDRDLGGGNWYVAEKTKSSNRGFFGSPPSQFSTG